MPLKDVEARKEYKRKCVVLLPDLKRNLLQNEKRCGKIIKEEVINKMMKSLIDQDKLVRLNNRVTYHKDILQDAQKIVMDHIRENQSITIAELRDKLKLSRKYTQAILEYFDTIGLTIRKEDRHVIK